MQLQVVVVPGNLLPFSQAKKHNFKDLSVGPGPISDLMKYQTL